MSLLEILTCFTHDYRDNLNKGLIYDGQYIDDEIQVRLLFNILAKIQRSLIF